MPNSTQPIDTVKQGVAHLAPRFMIPSLVGAVGSMMLVPTLPLYIRSQSESLTLVTVVLAAASVGAVVANIPAGWFIDRRGERRGFITGLALSAIGTVALAFGGGFLAASAACFVAGAGQSTRLLANQSYTRNALSGSVRGRVLSLFGGSMRFAMLLGPLLGGFVANLKGFEFTFGVAGALAGAGLIPALVIPASQYRTAKPTTQKPAKTSTVMRTHGKIIGLAGLGQLGVAIVRFGRLAVLPLYGQSIGLDVGQIGVTIAVASGIDLVMFPFAGWLMDTFGRLYAIMPSFLLMSAGLLLLPVTSSFAGLALVSSMIGLGNGLGSGTMLTLSVDLAPADNPARFLGLLRLLSDSGRIVGTILVGMVADQLDLGASAIVLGVVGLASAGLFALVIGETRDLDKQAV